jgi:hypothetical protein
MLFLALEVDRRVYRGVAFRSAFQQIKGMAGSFDRDMLAALDSYTPASSEFHRKAVPIKQLYAGMVLEQDVSSESNGMMIFRKGTVLTDLWIERLGNFARSHGIREPLRVRVPGPARAPVFRGPLKAALPNKAEIIR